MDMKIVSENVAVNGSDHEFIRYRIAFSLAGNREHIESVRILVREIPGFDLESINQCLVEVVLVDGTALTGDSTATDLHEAIHRSADRATEWVARHLEHQPGYYARAVDTRAVGSFERTPS